MRKAGELQAAIVERRSCLTCSYLSAPDTDNEFAQCRRHPPVVVYTGVSAYTTWPVVEDGDWCGDYHPDQRKMV